MNIRCFTSLALSALVLAVVAGCGGYELHGRVVAGDASYISIVDEDHPVLLESRGVGGASVHLQEDPGTLRSQTIARSTTNPDGTFSLPVDRIGAGMLEYDVGLFVRKQGYAPAELPFRLPGKGKAILVVLRSGEDRAIDESFDTLFEETIDSW